MVRVHINQIRRVRLCAIAKYNNYTRVYLYFHNFNSYLTNIYGNTFIKFNRHSSG